MELGRVFIDSVIVGERHRALNTDKIEALAESMDALGLQQPISVYLDGDDAHLVAGLHRLEAARKLGWEQIDASFITLSPARREMWEIAENLFRVDLSKEQRDEHIRRYAELLEEIEAEEVPENQDRQSVAPEIGYKKPPPQKTGIARRIAQETGISTRTVQRVLNPQTKPVPPPVEPHNPIEAYNKWAAEGNRWFGRGSQEWRDRWLAQIDTPVMDRGSEDFDPDRDMPEFLRRTA